MDPKIKPHSSKKNFPIRKASFLPKSSVQQGMSENTNGCKDNDRQIEAQSTQTSTTLVTEGKGDVSESGDIGIPRYQTDELSSMIRRRMTVPNVNSGCVGDENNAFRRSLSENTKLESASMEHMEKKLKSLVTAFSERTKRMKKLIQEPQTPLTSDSEIEESDETEGNLLERLKFLCSPDPSLIGAGKRKSISEKVKGSCTRKLKMLLNFLTCNYIVDADGTFYVSWLVLISMCFIYNAWVIPLRVIFPYQTAENLHVWMFLDYFADAVYFMDIIVFKSHRKFLSEGFWIKDPIEARNTYFGTWQFKIDLLALFPADILVALVYKNYPILRIPRLLKIDSYWELFRRLDTILASPYAARITYTMMYMMYMIHCNACAYYGLSTLEGIGTTTWTFDGLGNAYIRCFYFATKTATSIGKNPKPENEMEYLFMTFAWLSGVFVFAVLIGQGVILPYQIRDIIASATKNQTEHQAMTYATISYLRSLGVSTNLQDKVLLWLSYTWKTQKTLDESKILELLPIQMRTELALNLHVDTISKVKLFQNCEVEFLRELVVKLRSITVLPGDYVCRKGEIGHDMYIVKSGKIHVIGGSSGTDILVTLMEGSVFGEIALLGIGGMNKRTADVRSAGFANLFVLSKNGLDEVIRDYPNSQQIIKKKAKKLMKENSRRAKAAASVGKANVGSSVQGTSDLELIGEVIIKNKVEPPKLIKTIMQMFPPGSKMRRYLSLGSKADSDKHLVPLSYPPTPYLPTPLERISPELDISIMSGDSSEKRLSPPPVSTSSQVRDVRSYPQDLFDSEEESRHESESCAEELMEYLDAEDFESGESSLGNLNSSLKIRSSPFLSVETSLTIDNQGKEFRAQIEETSLGGNGKQSPVDPVFYVQPPRLLTQVAPHRHPKNPSTSAHVKAHSAPAVFAFERERRESLPVERRPPIYPIVPHAPSSEKRENDDGTGIKNIGSTETPSTSASLIASHFLARIALRAPFKRQERQLSQEIGSDETTEENVTD